MNLVSNIPLKKYIIAFILAFMITLVVLAAASIVFSFLPPPTWILNAVHDYSFLLSSFAAAFLCAKASSGRGFITGIIASDFYIGLLLALGGLIFKNTVSPISLIKIFSLGSIIGVIGGVLGINSK